MKKPAIQDLVRMVERDLDPRRPSEPPPGEEADRSDAADYEMLEHLRELWRLQNPKGPGARRSHRRFLGLPVRVAKRGFRVLFQPFINETLERQTAFNEEAVPLLEKMRSALLDRRRRTEEIAAGWEERLAAGETEAEERQASEREERARLAGRVDRLEVGVGERERETAGLRSRVERLEAAVDEKERVIRALEETTRTELRMAEEFERSYRGLLDELGRIVSAPGEGASAGDRVRSLLEEAGGSFDYARFHEGTSPEERTRELYAPYVDCFEGCRRVVDIGCGRGLFLGLLAERGIPAYGVDRDGRLVGRAVAAGHDAREGEGIAHLESLAAGEVDGVFLGHVVEHLDLDRLLRLVRLVHRRLSPGGVLVLESPNTENVLVLASSYFRDPSHHRPRHPETYRFLVEACGFAGARLEYRSPTPEEFKLRSLPEESGLPPGVVERLDRNTRKLNEILYGPINFSIIARKTEGGR